MNSFQEMKQSSTCQESSSNSKNNIRERWDQLVKPKDSLGQLEDWVTKLGAITGDDPPLVEPSAVLLFAGDHGVVEEGVSAYPSSVTARMLKVINEGRAAINNISSSSGVELRWYNVGSRSDLQRTDEKVGEVTGNIRTKPALSRRETKQAIKLGREAVGKAKADGIKLICLGEIGIGNTTPSTALVAKLLDQDPGGIVGPGSGLDEEGIKRKMNVLRDVLNRCEVPNDNPVELLRDIGGYELAALTGAVLEAHDRRMPVLLDGLITTVPAMLAQLREPEIKRILLASHCSTEPAHRLALETLGIDPMVDLDLCLGEGTGAALVVPLLRASVETYKHMATFAEAQIPGAD